MKTYNEETLQKVITDAIHEQNHFWWGCVIGSQYGKLSVLRVEKNEELSYCVDTEEERANTFMPIVRVKYGSPYENGNPKGHVVSWYNENHEPVNVSYLRYKPEPVVFETGATKDYINSLILFTDNTGDLIELRDGIYENHREETELKPEMFVDLCDAARFRFLREVGYESVEAKPIDKMRYKKNYNDVLEYCTIYVNRFADWKSDHS